MILIRQSYRYLATVLVTLTLGLFLTACGDNTNTPAAAPAPAQAGTTTLSLAPTTSASGTPQMVTATASTSTTPAMQMAATTASVNMSGTTSAMNMSGTTPVTGTTAAMSMGGMPAGSPPAGFAPVTGDSTLTLTNKDGSKVGLAKHPERVVCVSPTCVEMLAQLGLEPVAVDEFEVGYMNLPYIYGDKAKNITGRIGGTSFQLNIEDIAKAKPDLVIGLVGVDEYLAQPLSTIAPLWLVYPQTYKESEDGLRQLGRVTERNAQAEAEVKKFEDKLAAYKAKSPKNKSVMAVNLINNKDVYLEEANAPNCALLNEIARCQWSVPGGTGMHVGIVKYSYEQLLKDNPNTIFVYGQTPLKSEEALPKPLDLVANDPLWKNLSAVKNGQVFNVNPFEWSFDYGLRSFAAVLDATAPKLYPDVFPQALP